ncbi:MAG TPA: tetratricopeptide repeat protein, partial [Parafilimonas sp.]|nr:tetratricopeptide repeat protein [Parafilimonas sp.]
MRSLKNLLSLLFSPVFVTAQFQHDQLDSMHMVLQHATNDTIRMDACLKFGSYYDDVNLDSSVYYSEKGILIAKQLQLKLNEAEMLTNMSWPLVKMGNYPRSLKVLDEALEIAGDPSNEKNTWHLLKGQTPRSYRIDLLGNVHSAFDYLYGYTGNYAKQITEAYEGIRLFESVSDTLLQAYTYTDIGNAYIKLNKLDSALYFEQKALRYYSAIPFKERKYEAEAHSQIGQIYLQMGNIDLARENFEKAIRISEQQNNPAKQGDAHLQLASLYQSLSKTDSCLFHAQKAVQAFSLVGKEKSKAAAYRKISDYYWDQNKPDSSFRYLRLATILNDSVDKIEKEKLREFQLEGFNEALRLKELEKENIQTQSKIRTYVMLAGIAVFMLIAFLLYRNNRNRKKANTVLQKQKEEVQSTLGELKATQAQLIQSEKMASLGELTAGIAHEIQNPLNFVNNFSEVNGELISELVDEVDKGNYDEVKVIAVSIKDNEEKIKSHGQRADAIVKGMLQHTRKSAGQTQPTDINALCEEYMRLSFHGLRAKDKDFNAQLETNFDGSIGKINVVPQDIGRVLLNLYNNAFYAVSQKLAAQGSKLEANNKCYVPTVTIVTKKISDKILISVRDNGAGIP